MLKIKQLVITLLSVLSLNMLYNNGYTAIVASPGLELLNHAQLVGLVDSAKKIHFTVHLNIRNKQKLDTLYRDIYNPHSPHYHQYLTTEEYQATFAPTAKTFALVQKYFTDQGMQQVTIAGNGIKVTASVEEIERTFKIKIHYYLYKNKKIYANNVKPHVDNAIAPYISDITGLNNIPRFHKMVLSVPRHPSPKNNAKLHQVNQTTLSHLTWDAFTPFAPPTDASLNGFTGSQLRTTYSLSAIPPTNGQTLDGTGQTIVILDEWGVNDPATIMADANQFSTLNNLPLFSMTSSPGHPANFAVVHSDGTPYGIHHRDPDQGWADEIALDLASAHTIAPNANVVLVLNNNLDLSTIITTILNSADVSFAGFPNAYVLSNSWGGTEYTDATLETNLQLAASRGLSIHFSSADCGDGSYNSSWPCSTVSNPPRVEYPASSPFTTALGGSSVFVDDNYVYSFEAGWGSYYAGSGFYAGSTGGISQLYNTPDWQNNSTFQNFIAGGYGVIGNHGGKRAVPDIAMLGDIHTGIIAYYSHGCESGCIFGGTSVACPLYSGAIALINQSRLLQHKQPIGLTAQYLYTLNQELSMNHALHFITAPHLTPDNSRPNPPNAPNYVFTLFDNSNWYSQIVTFNWDSSLTMNENQYWNDVVGVGSPNLPVFVPFMAAL